MSRNLDFELQNYLFDEVIKKIRRVSDSKFTTTPRLDNEKIIA